MISNYFPSYLPDKYNLQLNMYFNTVWFTSSWQNWAHFQQICYDFLTSFEFSLNVFTEFAKFSYKNICHYSKRAQTCYPATSCVRVQDDTQCQQDTCETGSLNWTQFMLQWFITFPEFAKFSEFLFHLGKTPLSVWKLWHLIVWDHYLNYRTILENEYLPKSKFWCSSGVIFIDYFKKFC